MWILILLAISINNPSDTPGRITVEFKSKQECEDALKTVTYSLKYKSYKIESSCEKKS